MDVLHTEIDAKCVPLKDMFGEGKIVVARGKDGSAIIGYYNGRRAPVTISIHRDDVPKLRKALDPENGCVRKP